MGPGSEEGRGLLWRRRCLWGGTTDDESHRGGRRAEEGVSGRGRAARGSRARHNTQQLAGGLSEPRMLPAHCCCCCWWFQAQLMSS